MLKDACGRSIEYLRLSVTDRCNIRCRYCLPASRAQWREREEFLNFTEITRIVRVLVGMGVKRVRITGGEPLLRPDLPELVARLKAISGLEDLSLTTNGLRLEEQAFALASAGLDRVNIHLDTLNPLRYSHVTRGGELDQVLAGIQAARAARLDPIKLNTVLQKGVNEEEISSLARFAARHQLVLRFIEIMPIGEGLNLTDRYLPADFVLERLAEEFRLLAYGQSLGGGPAEYFKILELNSVLGVIRPVSQPFCESCNRVRLSADGRFQDCLAYEDSAGLLEILRGDSCSEEALKEILRERIGLKRPDHGGFQREGCNATRGMYGIGG